MSKKQTIKPISLAIGAAFVAGIASAPVVQADINPFAVTALSSGYMVAEKGAEGQCGANKAAKKVNEAECGANKATNKVNEAAQPKPVVEAKCGEAKCGNNK